MPAQPQRSDASAAVRTFHSLRRHSLQSMVSPLEECARLRQALPDAPRIFIKRDDYLGFLLGGNKLRKLEYIFADALQQGATTVMTIGPIQSNHARVTAMVARRRGLKCCLVLSGAPPVDKRANFLIVKMLGVEIRFVPRREDREAAMAAWADELEGRGERVYCIPLGGTNDIGSFGFVAALEELYTQDPLLVQRLSAIIIASSAGGSQVGLEVGKRLFNLRGLRVIGVSPDEPADVIRANVVRWVNPMLERLGIQENVSAEEVVADDSQVGKGYRIPTAASEEAARVFVELEGILLDHAYTSKAAAALLSYCRSGRFSSNENVLFWHTGGLVALLE